MNFLDRAIAWFSPERGLRRAAARDAIDRVAHQAYDGARLGRRMDGWTTGTTSANAEVLGALGRLSARSRDLVRNDSNINSAKRAIRNYAVGTGIELQFENRRWQALWDEWVEQCDADGLLPFHGIQSLAAATIFESGSVLLRRRWRRAEDGLTVPLQIQALEPDHLDPSRDSQRDRGGWIQAGVEFDALGRRIGYWLFPVHPGESAAATFSRGFGESRFVPAAEVSHAFVVERPGQVTGVPWPSPVIVRARDLGDYDDAELFRKKIEACSVGAVIQAGGPFGNPLGPKPTGAPAGSGFGGKDGTPRPEQFEPGTFHYMAPGEDVKFNDPKGNTAYAAYVRAQQQAIGAGIGVPYDKLTGDLTQVNYSSLKAGGNQFEQSMDVFRWLTLIPRVCDVVLQWFFEAAEVSGAAPTTRRPAYEWQPPPYPEVDPFKESTARVLDMRAGVRTPQEVIRSRGSDPMKQLEQIAAWNEELDRLGVVLDSDPRKVTRAGLAQSADPTEGGGDEEEE